MAHPDHTTARTKDTTIACYTCGRRVTTVRSVRIRGDCSEEFHRLRQRFPDLNCLSPQQANEFHSAYAQYKRNTNYRRAFICQDCYENLDTFVGIGTIVVENKPKNFGLSGDSRFNKAAMYDYKKWLSYQKRKAKEMGLSYDG